MEDLDKLRSELVAAVNDASDLDGIESLRVAALGKKGRLTALMKSLGSMAPEERRTAGATLNVVKSEVAQAIERRKTELADIELDARLAQESVDVTLPVRPEREGAIHPISQTIDEVVAIFGEMGFSVAEGPDIENDWNNFTALNIPAEHPARQEMDTFYLPNDAEGNRMVLRTHTSPVQIRTMQTNPPPLRIIAPGRNLSL